MRYQRSDKREPVAVNSLSSHPSFQRLCDYFDERLSATERPSVQEHVSSCARCRRDLAWLGQTAALMRSDDSVDAPAHVVARAVRLVRPQPAGASRLQRLVAALSFDSMINRPDFAVRGGAGAERQMLFSAGDHDIDLRINEQNGRWMVSGQTLGPCTGGSVTLTGAGDTVRGTMSAWCEFDLPPVPAGLYELVIALTAAESEIAIPALLLGNPDQL